MKPSMVILFILISLSLMFSVVTIVILFENHIGFVPLPTTSPTNTGTLHPTPFVTNEPSSSTVLDVSYIESNREQINENTTSVTVTINATYVNGTSVELSYSQFYLNLFVARNVLQLPTGTAQPLNNGYITLNGSQRTQIFTLNFNFRAHDSNGMDIAATQYYLSFNGIQTIQWVPWYS